MKRKAVVKVMFRMFEGAVVALFPEIPGAPEFDCVCLSYAHIGQHSAADPFMVVRQSRRATDEEYKPLLHELKDIGYKGLVIVERMSPKMRAARKDAARR